MRAKGTRLGKLSSLHVLGLAMAYGAVSLPATISAQPSNSLPLPSAAEAAYLASIERARKGGAMISEQTILDIRKSLRMSEQFQDQMKVEGENNEELMNIELWQQVQAPLTRNLGKEGIPFPASNEVVWPPEPTPDASKEVAAPRIVAPTPTPYRLPPPRCTRDETVKSVFQPGQAEDTVLLDRLFIPEDTVPFDSQEAFGAAVDVIPYGTNSAPDVAIALRIYAVPCLPYRKRITNTTEYLDAGANALKNYDSGYSGKGEWDPVMFQKLFPGKRLPPAPRRTSVPRVRR
jgi:hypothetical protein